MEKKEIAKTSKKLPSSSRPAETPSSQQSSGAIGGVLPADADIETLLDMLMEKKKEWRPSRLSGSSLTAEFPSKQSSPRASGGVLGAGDAELDPSPNPIMKKRESTKSSRLSGSSRAAEIPSQRPPVTGMEMLAAVDQKIDKCLKDIQDKKDSRSPFKLPISSRSADVIPPQQSSASGAGAEVLPVAKKVIEYFRLYEKAEGRSLTKFIDHVRAQGVDGLMEEFADIANIPIEADCTMFSANKSKNRYSDMLVLDQTRVVLPTSKERVNYFERCDYINANFVDGWGQKNAFICTQGPLPSTFVDFWRMIWDQNCMVIVMTAMVWEAGKEKCGQYWPLEKNSELMILMDRFQIENVGVKEQQYHKLTKLELTNLKTGEVRGISHVQYMWWPDRGVPAETRSTLQLLKMMREEQRMRFGKFMRKTSTKWEGHYYGPPIVMHCSAGVGRTGTLVAIDICIERLTFEHQVDVMQIVEVVRSQRAYSVQTPQQYLFVYAAIVDHIKNNQLLSTLSLNRIPDLLEVGDINDRFEWFSV